MYVSFFCHLITGFPGLFVYERESFQPVFWLKNINMITNEATLHSLFNNSNQQLTVFITLTLILTYTSFSQIYRRGHEFISFLPNHPRICFACFLAFLTNASVCFFCIRSRESGPSQWEKSLGLPIPEEKMNGKKNIHAEHSITERILLL